MGTGLLLVFFAVAIAVWVKLEPHVPARHDGSRWSLRLGLPVTWYTARAPVPVPDGDGVIEVVEADGRYVIGERHEPWDAKPTTRSVGRGKTGTLALLSRDRRRLTVWAGPYASLFIVLIPLFVVPQVLLAQGRYLASIDDAVATACSALLVVFWVGMWWSLVRRARRYASYVGFLPWMWYEGDG